MLKNIINYLHFIPLLAIITMITANFLYSKVKGIKLFDKSLLPVILLLTSIGVASGVNIHDHDHGAFFSGCYICFAYSFVLVGVALKISMMSAFSRNSSKKVVAIDSSDF